MHMKISSMKWQPFCPWGDELNHTIICIYRVSLKIQLLAKRKEKKHQLLAKWKEKMKCQVCIGSPVFLGHHTPHHASHHCAPKLQWGECLPGSQLLAIITAGSLDHAHRDVHKIQTQWGNSPAHSHQEEGPNSRWVSFFKFKIDFHD